MHPTTGGRTEINQCGGVVEEIVLTVELDEFVGGSGTVALGLGEMIVSIESLLGFGFLTHENVDLAIYYINKVLYY